jgi:carbon-monoxide dehydrogenase medium subunit
LKANCTAGALDGVKISADGLLNDLRGSSDYRANLIKLMTQRALEV